MRLIFMLFAAVLTACGSQVDGSSADAGSADAGSADTGGAPATVEALCVDYAAAYCRNHDTCSTPVDRLVTGDEDACRTWAERRCVWTHTLHGRADAVADLQACVASLRDAACGSAPEVARNCRFTGELADDARCAADEQCASGACRMEDTYVPSCGVCKVTPTAGQSCASDAECRGDFFAPPELFCDVASKMCAPRGGEGAACMNDGTCRNGLACVSAVCRAALTTEGAPCGSTIAGCSLDAGLYCDLKSDRCAKLRVASAGESCSAYGTICEPNAYCGHPSSVCKPRAALGAACGGGDSCVMGAACVEGTCVSLNDHCR